MRFIKSWFWVGPRESENWAQTLIRVSGNLLRDALTIVLAVVGGMLALPALSNFWTSSLSEVRKVEVTVEHRRQTDLARDDGELFCSEERPLIVKISNSSSRALAALDIQLVGRARGKVGNQLNWSSRKISWDRVIPPNHFNVACFGNDGVRTQTDLIYSGSIDQSSVRLVEVEDWMFEESSAVRLKDR